MKLFDELNDYYRKNPPAIVLDTIGIHHPVEVPLSTTYVKIPCECGIIHKWEEPETFSVELRTLTDPEIPSYETKVKICKKCKHILKLKLSDGVMEQKPTDSTKKEEND